MSRSDSHLCPLSPTTVLRGLQGTQTGRRGLGNSCCPRPGKGRGLQLGDCSQIPGGTSHSASPHPLPPTQSSCFLQHKDHTGHTLPVARPARHLPPLAPTSPVPPCLSFPAPSIPGAGRALTVGARASGPAARTPRPAGGPQGGGDGGRGGGGAEVGGGQQGGGGGGSRQAGFAEAAGYGRGHQAAEGEGTRAVAGQALYGLGGAALLACSGHGAPWGLQDRAEGCGQPGSAGTHPTRGTQGTPLLYTWQARQPRAGAHNTRRAQSEGTVGACDGPSRHIPPG